eukprot:6600936-Prymnesium_polylepis.1
MASLELWRVCSAVHTNTSCEGFVSGRGVVSWASDVGVRPPPIAMAFAMGYHTNPLHPKAPEGDLRCKFPLAANSLYEARLRAAEDHSAYLRTLHRPLGELPADGAALAEEYKHHIGLSKWNVDGRMGVKPPTRGSTTWPFRPKIASFPLNVFDFGIPPGTMRNRVELAPVGAARAVGDVRPPAAFPSRKLPR